jgi:hypothetical protein
LFGYETLFSDGTSHLMDDEKNPSAFTSEFFFLAMRVVPYRNTLPTKVNP